MVDRLWPRGVSKEKAHIDYWLKDIAPSTELRKWFHQDFANFPLFKERYIEELETEQEKRDAVEFIFKHNSDTPITLLYSAKNEADNHAVVLKDYLFSQVVDQ